jgi:hypothetical protein
MSKAHGILLTVGWSDGGLGGGSEPIEEVAAS